jgi:hypothetical protein
MVELALLQSLLAGEPYYGPALRADADADGREALAAILEKLRALKASPRVLEVGCWLGAGTAQLAAGLGRLFSDWQLTCLEDFHAPLECATGHPVAPDERIDFYAQAARAGVLPGLLEHNLRHDKQRSRLHFVNEPLLAALRGYAAGAFDLVVLHGPRALSQFDDILGHCVRICAADGIVCGSGLLLREDEAEPNGLRYCLRFPKRSYTAYDERTGIRYYPEITHALSERFGMVPACRGFWAVHVRPDAVPVPMAMPASPQTPQPVDAAEQYQIVPRADGRYVVLHASIPASRLAGERLGEREIPELLALCDTRQQAEAEANCLNERRRRQKGVWLDTTPYYYLVKFGASTYMAQSKFLNPPKGLKVFSRILGEDELEPLLLLASSLEELRRKVALHEAAVRAEKQSLPIRERYQGYYLYEARQDHWVAVSLAVTRGRPFQNYLGEEDIAPSVLTAKSLEALRDRIEHMVNRDGNNEALSQATEHWL